MYSIQEAVHTEFAVCDTESNLDWGHNIRHKCSLDCGQSIKYFGTVLTKAVMFTKYFNAFWEEELLWINNLWPMLHYIKFQ